MKKIFVFGLSTLVFLSACRHESVKESDKNKEVKSLKKVDMPKEFYLKLKGKIGNIPVTFDLMKDDSTLSGSYYYDKVGQPLSFNGTVKDDGTFTIREMNEKYEETGVFKGVFIDDKTLEGTWSNTKNSKSFPFKLKEVTGDFVALVTKDYHTENCDLANKNKQNYNQDMSMWDTVCTSLDVSMMTVTVPNGQATQLINKRITDIVVNSGYVSGLKSIDDLMNSVNGLGEGEGYELSINCSLVTNDKNIFCIYIGQSDYNFGAAHPNSGGSYYNFDIRNGNELGLKDILLPGYEEKLNSIGEKNFVETNGSEGWNFEPGEFKLNNDFAIRPGGLTFSFDQYEIGPYAAGAPEVFIPFKEIKNLINPNGPLAHWVK